MNPRRWLLLVPAGILSMTVLVFLALLVSALDAGGRGSERETIMLQTKTSAVRPPMDAAVPARLETATFALG